MRLVLLLLWPVLSFAAPATDSSVRELLAALGVKESMKKVQADQVDLMLQQNPDLESIRPKLETFFSQTLSWSAVEPLLTEGWRKHLQEEDVAEALRFYRSPAGKKITAATPAFQRELDRVVVGLVDRNSGSLRQLLAESYGPAAR